VKCPVFCPIVTKSEIPQQIFKEVPHIKFHINPSSRSRDDTWRKTNRRTDMTKVTGVSCEYENAPKISRLTARYGNPKTVSLKSSGMLRSMQFPKFWRIVMLSSLGSSYLETPKHQKLLTRRHSVRSQKTCKSFSLYCLQTAFKMNVLPVATATSSSVTRTLLKQTRQPMYV
jgi:hypothetical protein